MVSERDDSELFNILILMLSLYSDNELDFREILLRQFEFSQIIKR